MWGVGFEGGGLDMGIRIGGSWWWVGMGMAEVVGEYVSV